MAGECVVVLSTAPDVDTARHIARALVERGLAACVNIAPGLTSIYTWQDSVHDDAEVLLVAKTGAGTADALVEALVGLHPYEVPEAIVLPIAGGHGPYLDWVRAATDPAAGKKG